LIFSNYYGIVPLNPDYFTILAPKSIYFPYGKEFKPSKGSSKGIYFPYGKEFKLEFPFQNPIYFPYRK